MLGTASWLEAASRNENSEAASRINRQAAAKTATGLTELATARTARELQYFCYVITSNGV